MVQKSPISYKKKKKKKKKKKRTSGFFQVRKTVIMRAERHTNRTEQTHGRENKQLVWFLAAWLNIRERQEGKEWEKSSDSVVDSANKPSGRLCVFMVTSRIKLSMLRLFTLTGSVVQDFYSWTVFRNRSEVFLLYYSLQR